MLNINIKKFPYLMRYAFILLLIILLSSCSHTSRKDGPPDFYVDETRIPNAVPKPERLSKYGNMPMYRVFGKRYYTMNSVKHYEKTGIASWYGTKFHSHRTSSGEPYNMLAMTAAHKTLPLPTYVEVTNLKNHKKVIVKVNDRGPFESNRLIDLSYVAAKKLGMLGHGTAWVKVSSIDPYEYAHRNDGYYPSHQRHYLPNIRHPKLIASKEVHIKKHHREQHIVATKTIKKHHEKIMVLNTTTKKTKIKRSHLSLRKKSNPKRYEI